MQEYPVNRATVSKMDELVQTRSNATLSVSALFFPQCEKLEAQADILDTEFKQNFVYP